ALPETDVLDSGFVLVLVLGKSAPLLTLSHSPVPPPSIGLPPFLTEDRLLNTRSLLPQIGF
ncbi:MAG: hypothetical protein ACKV19_15320, partial [Verrucomicrobiales bacterium]